MQKTDKIILYVIIVLVLLFFIYLIWNSNREGFEDGPSSNIDKGGSPSVWKNIDLIFDTEGNKIGTGLPITSEHLTSKDNSSIYDLEYKLFYSKNPKNSAIVLLYQYYRYFLSGGLSKDQYKTMTEIIIPGLNSLLKDDVLNMVRMKKLLDGTNITTDDLGKGITIDQLNTILKWLSDPANNEPTA